MNEEELEGKVINIIHVGGSISRGLVVGCDRDIGITIVDYYYNDYYLLCLRGPSSPLWKKLRFYRGEEAEKAEHYELSDCLIEQIKSGTVKIKETFSIIPINEIGRRPTKESCPFGQ